MSKQRTWFNNSLLLLTVSLCAGSSSLAHATTAIRPLDKKALDSTKRAEPAFFFKNSIRREARDSEKKSVLYGGGCTAFYVANKENKFYVATARHCHDYQMTKECGQPFESGDGAFYTAQVPGSNWGPMAKCTRVVAGTAKDDLVVIEVKFLNEKDEQEARENLSFLKLAAYKAKPGDGLKMIGFPGDKKRNGELTVTENCWDNTNHATEATSGVLNTQVVAGNVAPKNKLARSLQRELNREFRWHNCSVYGGNSGGPMLLDGTDHVIGIPSSYLESPKVYSQNSPTFYETTAGFVKRNRKALEAEGVIIAEQPDYSKEVSLQSKKPKVIR